MAPPLLQHMQDGVLVVRVGTIIPHCIFGLFIVHHLGAFSAVNSTKIFSVNELTEREVEKCANRFHAKQSQPCLVQKNSRLFGYIIVYQFKAQSLQPSADSLCKITGTSCQV